MTRGSPRPILLLMDYQEAICRASGTIGRSGIGAQVEARHVLQAARRAALAFREAGSPVVHVRVAFDGAYTRLTSASPRFAAMREQRLLLEEDPATRICEEVAPLDEEVIITKGCVNPFVGTHLQQTLTRLCPTELVLGGVATNHVVESTARLAADMGYPVIVLEDLCAAASDELHRFAIEKVIPHYATVRNSVEYLRGVRA